MVECRHDETISMVPCVVNNILYSYVAAQDGYLGQMSETCCDNNEPLYSFIVVNILANNKLFVQITNKSTENILSYYQHVQRPYSALSFNI